MFDCLLLPILLASQAAATDAAGRESGIIEELKQQATASRLQGHPDEAERALTRAFPLAARLYGDTSLELASLLSEMSAAQRAQGKKKQALLSLESALRMRDGYPAERLPDLANDLLSAATIRIDIDDDKTAAKDLLNRALAVSGKAFPTDSPQTIRILDALAGVLRERSEYSEAEPLYMRLLRLREAAFGPESVELISTLDSLAYVYFGLQRYDDAEPVYRRLLALWEANVGPDHPMIALTLDKMTEFYAAQMRYADAAPLVERATAMRSRALIDSLVRAARVQLADSKLDEAAELYRRALAAADEIKLTGKTIDPLLEAYARILRDLDRGGEAEAIEERRTKP
jgi:tetratricopeptide (TPR) repeat protein